MISMITMIMTMITTITKISMISMMRITYRAKARSSQGEEAIRCPVLLDGGPEPDCHHRIIVGSS